MSAKATAKAITVILADDHEIFRDGFMVMLQKNKEISIIDQAVNGLDLIRKVKSAKPRVVVTDIRMPILDGIEATRQINREFPEIGVIALSMFGEEDLVIDMLKAGAKGYLIKNAAKDEIIAAIKAVNEGYTYYCKQTTRTLAQMIAKSDFEPDFKINKLTFSNKALAIIRLICEEYSTKEIAEEMEISARTVEGHREKILRKVGARNTAGLVIYAMKNKLFP